MTKCNNCGQSFSDTVYPLHIQRCNPEPPVEIAPAENEETKNPEPPVENEQSSKKTGKKK